MSTIKSSSEHLVLNADGANKDIKFQANGVEKASISSAGAFTSTTIDATALTGTIPNFTSTGIDDNATSTAVTLDSSGNVGIGTSSPSKKLDIAVSGTDGLLMSGANGYVGSTNDLVIDVDSNNDYSGNAIKFTQHNGASELMRIADSGNVGIGVVPESWQSARAVLQIGTQGSVSGNNTALGTVEYANNYYVGTDNSSKYINTDQATMYEQHYTGEHRFKVAPSGTADTAITWTTAMTIDNSGAVTMPSQPAFSVYNNTAQNGIGSGWTTINMDTEIFDQNADFNTGTYTFTAPVTGKYLLTTQVCTRNIDNTTQWFIVAIQTSNRGYNASRTTGHWSADSNGFNKGIPMTAVADMDANDTAYVRFYRYLGGTTADIISASEYTFFQGYLLG